MVDPNKATSIKVIIGTIVVAMFVNGIAGSLKPKPATLKQENTSNQTVVEETKRTEAEVNTTATNQVKEETTNSSMDPTTITPPPSTASTVKTESIQTTSNSPVVKKSSTGICHAPGTTYYDRTSNYSSYNSVQDCLSSGGRLPKK